MTASIDATGEPQPALTEQSERRQADAPADAVHDEDSHLTGVPLYALLASLFLIMIIVTLDISILSTAIPVSLFAKVYRVSQIMAAYVPTTCVGFTRHLGPLIQVLSTDENR